MTATGNYILVKDLTVVTKHTQNGNTVYVKNDMN